MTLAQFLLARIAEVEQLSISIAGYHRDDVESNFALCVLAECEAKRRVVKVAQAAQDPKLQPETRLAGDLVLRNLALPYAGHPDYRSEWRP